MVNFKDLDNYERWGAMQDIIDETYYTTDLESMWWDIDSSLSGYTSIYGIPYIGDLILPDPLFSIWLIDTDV